MRVLHFYKTAFPDTMGGVEQVVHQIASKGKQFGIHAEVLSLTTNKMPQTTVMDGYLIHRERLDFQIASTGFSTSVIKRFSQLAQKADVIHYHFPWPFMDVVHFVARMHKPTVLTYHSDIVRQKHLLRVYRPLMRLFLSSVDRIVATSPNYLVTSEVLNHFSDKTRIIPIGLDEDSYPKPLPERLEYWRRHVGEKFFLFVGVLRYYKGLHILLEAAIDTNYPIVVVGSGPIESEMKKKAIRLGLRNIIFLGYLDDIDKVALFTLCYSVVFPSHLRSEAFGVSLLEGAMYGKPLISCEIGTGTSFININNETGIVVPPSNIEALRQAMQFLWQNPTKARSMGKRAKARYCEYFSGEKMLGAYAELYSELVPKLSWPRELLE